MNKKISLLLLTYNGKKYLPNLTSQISGQKGNYEIELVVVDSGSSDGSVEFMEELKKWCINNKKTAIKSVKILTIKNDDFNHGGTRNLGVKNASNNIVVLLSQDALPKDEWWLNTLVKPLEDSEVAGVFGRQVVYPGTNFMEEFFYQESYSDRSRVLTEKDVENFSNQNLFFSNVNGVVKKDLLLKFPFRDDLLMSEDQYWGREVLKGGYKIVYEPNAVVLHSHNYSLAKLFKRYAQSGYSLSQLKMSGQPMKKGAGASLKLLKYLFKKDLKMVPYALLYLLVKGSGFICGKMGWYK